MDGFKVKLKPESLGFPLNQFWDKQSEQDGHDLKTPLYTHDHILLYMYIYIYKYKYTILRVLVYTLVFNIVFILHTSKYIRCYITLYNSP
jgi:hypothetical protein